MSERKTPPEGVTGAAAGTTDRSMPEAQSGSSAQPREALKIASGYAFTGSALDLGALMWGRRLSAGRAGQDPAAVAQPAGDVPGISEPGVRNEKVQARAAEVHQTWAATGCPAEFHALGGIGHGTPVRATVTSFGPVLLSKVLQRQGRRGSTARRRR